MRGLKELGARLWRNRGELVRADLIVGLMALALLFAPYFPEFSIKAASFVSGAMLVANAINRALARPVLVIEGLGEQRRENAVRYYLRVRCSGSTSARNVRGIITLYLVSESGRESSLEPLLVHKDVRRGCGARPPYCSAGYTHSPLMIPEERRGGYDVRRCYKVSSEDPVVRGETLPWSLPDPTGV